MLKFINTNGKLEYVLLDGDTQPRSTEDKKVKKLLKKLGITIEDEKYKEILRPSGLSQDDIKHFKGE